jgi:hypothetical protein
MKIRTVGVALMIAATLGLAACAGGDGGSSNDEGGNDGGAAPASDVLEIVAPSGAANSGYGTTEFSAPADTPFTIHFVNEDEGIPHDVRIYEDMDVTGTPVFAPADGAMITGPDEVDYEVPALSAGTYTITCMAHPTTMVGTLTVA